MDWFSKLEQHRRLTLSLFFIVAVAVLSASALREPFALDSYWHLKMGQDWVEKGLSPYEDHYSITHEGKRIGGVPVPFQVALYAIVDLFGVDAGFKLIVYLSNLLVLGLAFLWLRQNRAPVWVIGIVVGMLVVLLQTRAMVRPEIFSYSLMVLALLLYERTRVRPTALNFLLVVLLLLAWRNYHSVVLGYVIFFGLFVDLAFQQLKERAALKRWLILGAWGLATLAVGYIHYDLRSPIIDMLRPSGMEPWLTFIDEYRPALRGEVNVATLILIPLSILSLALLLHLRLFGYFIVCAVMSWYAITMFRMTTPSGIVVVCLLGMSLSRTDFSSWMDRTSQVGRALASGFAFVLLAAAFVISVLQARAMLEANRSMLGYFPDRLVEYMKTSKMAGLIFNDYRIGGYLIYHLGDSSRVYIDGRTNILYPYDHALRWKEAMMSSAALREEIQKYDIDFVIVGNRRQFIDLVNDTGLMTLDFSDLRYSLYTREDANFPTLGRLWSLPWCWNDNLGPELSREMPKVKELLPSYSPVTHLSNLVNDYYDAPDRVAYVESLADMPINELYDDDLRFLAHRALDNELYELATKWFHAVRIKSFKDYLGGAMANLRAGRVDRAEEILYHSSQVNWSLTDINDVRMLYVLLSEIRSERELRYLAPSYIDEVGSMAGFPALPPPQFRTFSSIFCG